jgi:two-component system, NtrC family, response regulator HydG
MKKILVVDNQISTCELLQKFLSKKNFDVETTTLGRNALSLLQKTPYDIVICDYRLPDIDGEEFFEKVMEAAPETHIIFMSREVNLKNAVDLIRRGAFNYLAKPLNPDELLEVLIEKKHRPLYREFGKKDGDSRPYLHSIHKSGLIHPGLEEEMGFVFGKSEIALKMLNQVERVGATNYTVIIEGETGTGKESLARLIHNVSPRRDQPFVAVDCGSLSKEIANSELFGHEKGSFTGAVMAKTGFFEQANGGTIFLDEIANLSLETQMALLRALQEKVIRKIGGMKEIPIDVRIIAATNEDLLTKSETSGFREDLFFRLSEFVLKVPALRERKEDLPLFIDFFLKNTANELGSETPKLSQEVIDFFYEYPWPGNIRELKNVIRRACLFVESDNYIYKEALPVRILEYANTHPANEEMQEEDELQLVEQEGGILNGVVSGTDLKSTALHAESKRIIEVLKKVHFNKTKAAEILNIHRKTLYTKLKLMNIPY